MAYKIESGIKQPKDKAQFPWGDMKVGDSIYIPNRADQASILSSATNWSLRNHGGKWKFRTQKEGKGIRVWRKK